jgi:hypothetical protein
MHPSPSSSFELPGRAVRHGEAERAFGGAVSRGGKAAWWTPPDERGVWSVRTTLCKWRRETCRTKRRVARLLLCWANKRVRHVA